MRSARAAGFTLIELMITLAIAGIFATVALPNLRDMVVRMRVKTAASDLHTALTFARSEAIKRNASVSVVPVSTSNWAQGWTVQVTSTSTVLTRQDAYSNVTFTPTSAAYGSKTVNSVAFQGTGREGSSDGVAFVLTATGYAGIAARCVVLDPSGRPTVRVDKNNNSADGCNA